ncbi:MULTISPECIES: YafY family protein [unclassified Fusibacter]|uniref:helix-turn-helix transcriptional regulator n=1 Tax=unclassified Fusibacter TaxID=2624464 RepID=UPI001011024A|nr:MULTISPECIES: YafY family protein [unclassified Fusibacter]MCK8061422.1 YafY family transcriptional regulator [Fusibacter sp. A2]NPE23535.1 YafY family transcriptional regulator [Fusibacter sp. A1]RXV58946.1 YafY family transcriptional regulator [Fusibacter sp. A1]
MKSERLLQIMLMMLNHNLVTAKELSIRYGVSIRTIQRDMDALSRMGIPIHSEQGVHGGYSIPTGYRIDRHTLTSKEQALILRTLRSVSGMVDDSDLNQAVAKISSVRATDVQLEPVWVDILPWDGNDQFSDLIGIIKQAIIDKKRLAFEYVKASGTTSQRKIDPFRVLLKGYSWYAYGFCHLRGENRLFKISRMRNLKRINENVYTTFSGEVPFANGEGHGEAIHVKCHKNIFYNGDTYIDPSKVIFDDEGYFEALLPFQIDHWTFGYLLSHSNYMEVISPKAVRDELLKRAKKAVDLYK